jgi:dipeptidyl aminopeptidase/acylaminoacyl peptidase
MVSSSGVVGGLLRTRGCPICRNLFPGFGLPPIGRLRIDYAMKRLTLVFLLALALGTPLAISGQSKPAVTRPDYGQFESISAGRGGGFSPDGKWLGYTVSRVDQTSELRLVRLADSLTKTTPFGGALTFSTDSRWALYTIGHSTADTDRLRAANRPVQNSLGILDLLSGAATTIEAVESFSLSGDAKYVALRKYRASTAPSGASGPPAASAPAGRGAAASDPVGATVIVRELSTGKETAFGNVAEFVWQDGDDAHRLAMTISADGRAGNGVHLFDPATSRLQVLEATPSSYTSLTWRPESTDLAVFKARTDDRHDGPAYVVLQWNVSEADPTPIVYDQAKDMAFPTTMRVTNFRRPSWSDDGKTMFLGIAEWAARPNTPASQAGRGSTETSGRRSPADGSTQDASAVALAKADEPAAVDIWHWRDVDVRAKQKLSAAADARRTLLAAWHLGSGKLVQIGKSFTEQVTPIRRTPTALVTEWSKYAMDRSIGRPAADLYVADLATGVRMKLRDNVIDRYVQVSPAAKYLLFLQDDHYWTINLATKAVADITKNAQTSFVDKESDETVRQKPAFGVAGWTKDDGEVVLYDKFDLWAVAPDGSRATRLTNGAADGVRHRLVRVNADEDYIDLAKPNYVSLFGVWSKKSGYARLVPGASRGAAPAVTVSPAVWLDRSVGGLGKARDAEVFSYSVQDYDDSPDIFVAGPSLADAKQVTTTNAFQSKYAWGRSETVEYKTDKGARLQGALYYPAGYEPGKRYPMIVYLYERLSDNVHRYVAPSDRDYYNTTVFTSQGYFVLQPDIVFRPREPGLSVVECVTPAVKRVVQMGVVDASRVGVIGHSWGGFDTAFLATHTNDVFAAAIAGAPITDLVSNYGNHHWSSGIAETDHIETGQQRMEVPLYEDLPAYIRNSAVFNVSNMTVPLLIEVGDSDGTVFWHQGVELYNIARRAGKNVVMLVYNGEDHGLRQKKNQVDYQQRILQWFGHYLKGEEAASWITGGRNP